MRLQHQAQCYYAFVRCNVIRWIVMIGIGIGVILYRYRRNFVTKYRFLTQYDYNICTIQQLVECQPPDTRVVDNVVDNAMLKTIEKGYTVDN